MPEREVTWVAADVSGRTYQEIRNWVHEGHDLPGFLLVHDQWSDQGRRIQVAAQDLERAMADLSPYWSGRDADAAAASIAAFVQYLTAMGTQIDGQADTLLDVHQAVVNVQARIPADGPPTAPTVQPAAPMPDIATEAVVAGVPDPATEIAAAAQNDAAAQAAYHEFLVATGMAATAAPAIAPPPDAIADDVGYSNGGWEPITDDGLGGPGTGVDGGSTPTLPPTTGSQGAPGLPPGTPGMAGVGGVGAAGLGALGAAAARDGSGPFGGSGARFSGFGGTSLRNGRAPAAGPGGPGGGPQLGQGPMNMRGPGVDGVFGGGPGGAGGAGGPTGSSGGSTGSTAGGGMPMAGAAGAGAGAGGDSKEHRRPTYLSEKQTELTSGEHVAPPVLGEPGDVYRNGTAR